MTDEIPHRLREVEQSVVEIKTTVRLHSDNINEKFDSIKEDISEFNENHKTITALLAKHDNELTKIEDREDRRTFWGKVFAVPIIGLLIERLFHLFKHTS